MGTGYTRNDTSNNIADGNVIDAADLDGEFDAIQSAFNSTTGHTHDGTSAEGAPITVTGPAQEYVSTGTELRAKTTNTYDLGSSGVQWKDLYVDGTGYIDTLSADAATVNGNITVTGTVDGRDIAADGTKLDGIEAGATADQTAAEIRALVEAATDSNVFTDADHTKLNGIEASADVTDTANVTAAGALMDSELTNITAVKALNQGVATTDSPAFAAVTINGNITVTGTVDGRDVATDGSKLDGIESGATGDQTAAEIRALVEAATDSNVFTDADHSKLNGIEAGADVTDTTNVTAAGALMDSELTNITAVKALNQGVATSDSPTFAGLTTTADVSFGDNDKAIFGAGSDLQIYHDGSHSYISDVGTGNLEVRAQNLLLKNSTGTETTAYFDQDGAVGIYYNGSQKLNTTATGVDVTGTVIADGLDMGDNDQIKLGTSDDLLIYHDGSHSYVQDSGTGNLYIAGNQLLLTNAAVNETYIKCVPNAATSLFYDNSEKLLTTSYGVSVTGSAVARTDTDTSNTGSVTLNFNTNQNFVLTLTGNVTLANPSTEKVGQSGFIVFIQDGTGGRTVSLGTDYETAGGAGLTLSATAGATDIVPYIVAASGRILLGTPQLAFS